jgi:hypothetical protein
VVTATTPGAVAAGDLAAAPAGPVDEAGTDDGAWVAAGVLLLMHADTSIPDAAIPSTSRTDRTGRIAPDEGRHLNEGMWPSSVSLVPVAAVARPRAPQADAVQRVMMGALG